MSVTLRLILGDQLNYNHSWFTKLDDNVIYLMIELRSETDYTQHHIQKILGFFAAMREFKNFHEKKGHRFIYITLDDPSNEQSFSENLDRVIGRYKVTKLELQEPDEYRLDQYFKEYLSGLNIESEIFSSEHFLTERNDLENFFGKKKKYLMENFYRRMRKKYQVLMQDDKPLGGQWNYDSKNRKKYPKKFAAPETLLFKNDVKDIFEMLSATDVKTIGEIKDPSTFNYPINRDQSLDLLDFFLEKLLCNFGTYQDAMSEDIYYGFHSRLSFALNTKILSPLELISAAERKFHEADDIDISQVEGFIRQILGWREFVRVFYWLKMPGLSKENYFQNTKQLPRFYWDADTKMNCLHHAIKASLDTAYAHHIQRLMLTGNFALLSEIHPEQVDDWYLGIYIDAIEWVELPNTRAMSQWADGGGLATKPYVSSANYINNMSDYCKNCHYDYKKKYDDETEKQACPFNSFYWDFLNKHRDKLGSNMRMSMVYKVWDKFDTEEQARILKQAELYKQDLHSL